MCGIIGFLEAPRRTSEILTEIGADMAARIAHRGPDHQDLWIDPSLALVLGYRRLAIQDLSPAGTQPMISASGRQVLVFNGEIYNFRELRRALIDIGVAFRGHSDTEVLVEAIDHWGLNAALERARGMFAFAVWDRGQRKLTLARDHFGKKPLYYGRFGGSLVFGSELKALAAHPQFACTIDRQAVRQLLRFSWIPGTSSVFNQVRKVPPGSTLELAVPLSEATPAPSAYWSAAEAAHSASETAYTGGFEAAVSELDRLLADAVRKRMIADVELGALLSGGIDSATIASLMQTQSNRPIRTFSIGFSETKYDEAPFAADIARHLGTDHTELYIGPDDLLACVPELPRIYDEPFADPSAVPTSIVSRLARQQVKVALSGDGGDEIFCGYHRYRRCLALWRRCRKWPWPMRRALTASLDALEAAAWQGLNGSEGAIGKPIGKLAQMPAKLAARHQGWDARNHAELFGTIRTHGHQVEDLVRDAPRALEPEALVGDDAGLADPIRAMMMLDVTSYLPDNNLTKLDRASMAVGLELRSPLLDQRVVEFAWRMPTDHLIDGKTSKRVLRGVLARYVPPELTDRPKRGFGVPIGTWLRGPLRDWAEDLLDPQRLAEGGILNPVGVQTLWRQHLAEWRDHKELLWSVLMFQAWWETWQTAASASPTSQ